MIVWEVWPQEKSLLPVRSTAWLGHVRLEGFIATVEGIGACQCQLLVSGLQTAIRTSLDLLLFSEW
jgi:hypothetical protein